MSLRNSCSESVVMSGRRSSVVFALRRARLSGARSTWAAGGRRVVVDELDLLGLDPGGELLAVGVVEIELGGRGRDVAVRQDARLLPARQQRLDLFEFLEFGD